jgi:cell division transport system permease protein
LFSVLLYTNALLSSSLEEIKSRVDVNVYFVSTTSEDDVLALKKRIEALPEVANAEYISRDQALTSFKTVHQNDEITLQALDELTDNPFGAILNIRAKETSQYESIAKFFETSAPVGTNGASIIDKVNYYQNKDAINSLTKIIEGGRKLGIGITLAFAIISIIIAFSTIRLAIYTSREEIGVMRLVGASNKYIRGPFIISGIIYGVFASLLTLGLFYPATYWFSIVTKNFFGGLNLFDYYLKHFAQVFGLIISSGVIVGAFGSFLAVRKYLKL